MTKYVENVDEKSSKLATNTDKETAKEEKNKKVGGADNEAVTFTEDEVIKIIQSECDKLRSKYSAEIKELKEQLEKLAPVELSEAEMEIEARLADLKRAQLEVNMQKQFFALQDSLQQKGIDKNIAAYLKSDVNVDEFAALINTMMKESTKSDGYIPNQHNAGDKVTVDEFKNMKYSEKEKMMKNSPELYKRLMAKVKR